MVTKMTQHVFDIGEKKIYFRVKQEGRKGQPVVIWDKKYLLSDVVQVDMSMASHFELYLLTWKLCV